MLSGVTGGLLPPPPQASSNPDSKKLDAKTRELNRITSSQGVRKLTLSHSAFVERVPGARAAFAGDACRGCLRNWHAGGMRKTIYPFADKQKIRYSRALLLARNMWKLSLDHSPAAEAGRRSSDSGEIVARNLPERHSHGKRPYAPAWSVLRVCSRSLQWLRRKLAYAKLMMSIFHGISTDRQPGASVRGDSHAVRKITRERVGYSGGNRRRRRPEAL